MALGWFSHARIMLDLGRGATALAVWRGVLTRFFPLGLLTVLVEYG